MKRTNYYTPMPLANLLIKQCTKKTPDSAIDICAGSWNLLHAVKYRWPETKLTGVDIDKCSIKSIINDGRFYANELLGEKKSYQLVVANPPFQYERYSEDIFRLISNHIAEYRFSKKILSRLENTMMIFNSLLVSSDGTLAAIVPDSMIRSESQRELRRYFGSEFYLRKIIFLPRNSFGSSDINTSIIILEKNNKKSSTRVYEAIDIKGDFKLQQLDSISKSKIAEGDWLNNNEHYFCGLENQFIDYVRIVRNNISTNNFDDTIEDGSVPVLHSSNILKNKHSKLNYYNPGNKIYHYTSAGDIAVIRVGRNCGEFLLVTKEEQDFLTSDCVLLIKPMDESIRGIIVNKLEEKKFNKKGVAARYITKNDILAMINPI